MFLQRLKTALPAPSALPGMRPVMLPVMLAAALALAGCSLAPEYHRPDLPVPGAVSEAGYDGTATVSDAPSADVRNLGWKNFFHDAQLRETINAALLHNKDLRLAALNVLAAKAQYRVQNADRFPQLGMDGGDKVAGTFITKGKDGFTAEVSMPAFELDFFGTREKPERIRAAKIPCQHRGGKSRAHRPCLADGAKLAGRTAGPRASATGAGNAEKPSGFLCLRFAAGQFRPGVHA